MIWVAEIGSMHKGNKDLAYELIRQAAQAGATIAKFQFGWTEDAQLAMGLKPNPVRFVDEWADDLNKWCQYFGVELMASIWSLEGLETARRVEMKRYKIAAQKAGDYALCDAIYDDTPNEVFVSLDRHSPYANYHKKRFGSLIYCKSKYPTYPKDISETIDYPGMPKEFDDITVGNWTGYSDHMHGIEPCLLAVARGAQYIEKHFCLDKTDLTVRDTVFSATPDEFAEMVRIGNGIRRLLDAQA
jgi:N,N'-diacetyllegionaminate synthase